MKQFVKASKFIGILLVLDNIEEAIRLVTERVKALADSLEQIDNNLELEEEEYEQTVHL